MQTLQSFLTDQLGLGVAAMVPLGGGDVAEAYRVLLDDSTTVFAKTKPGAVDGFFTTEATGLDWLRDTQTVAVPQVIAVADDPPVLVQQWIDQGDPTVSTEADLGRSLAALHQTRAACFGRQDRRSTGSRGLPNEPCSSWTEFFPSQRLLPLARLAQDSGALPEESIAELEHVALSVDRYGGTDEPPSILHGDLWAGNRLVSIGGASWLIDPAAHGGHREFDLAMMRLFGGFGWECFEAYQDVFPLADGWKQRIPLHQLAPLVVHAIKFGSSYVPATQSALRALR